MGFVNSLLGPFENISVKRNEVTYNEYNQPTGNDWSTVLTIQGKAQLGAMAESVVSDKYKSVVAAVAMIDPEDMSVEILSTDKIVIGTIEYAIITKDSIVLSDTSLVFDQVTVVDNEFLWKFGDDHE